MIGSYKCKSKRYQVCNNTKLIYLFVITAKLTLREIKGLTEVMKSASFGYLFVTDVLTICKSNIEITPDSLKNKNTLSKNVRKLS